MNILTKRIMKVTNFKDMYHYDLEGETTINGKKSIPIKRHIDIDVNVNGLKKVSRVYSDYENGKYNELIVVNHFRDDKGNLSMYEEHFVRYDDKFVKISEDDKIKSFIIDEHGILTRVKTDSMESEETEFDAPHKQLKTGMTSPLKFKGVLWTDPASADNGFKKTVIASDYTTTNVTKMSSVKTIDGKTIDTYTEDETVYSSTDKYTEDSGKYEAKYKPSYFTSTTRKVLSDKKLNELAIAIEEIDVIEKITHTICFNKKTPVANASTTIKNNVLFIDGINWFGNNTTLDILEEDSAFMKAIDSDIDVNAIIGINIETFKENPLAELAKLGYIVIVSTEVEKTNYDESLYTNASDGKFVSFDVTCYDKNHNCTLSINITGTGSIVISDREEFNEYGIKTLSIRQVANKKV